MSEGLVFPQLDVNIGKCALYGYEIELSVTYHILGYI